MKYICLMVLVTFITGCFTNKNVENPTYVELLLVKSSQIELVLKEVQEAYEKNYEFKDQVFVLRTEKIEKKLEVILSVYDKSDFENCFEARLFPLYGLYKYNLNSVLVYGDASKYLFQIQGQQVHFELLNCMKQKVKEVENGIPYPPEIFEPIVWIYTGNVEKLIYKEQAQFNIIE